MKLHPKTVGYGLLSAGLLLAAPVARAQMSTELIMETYSSNMNVITTGAINKATMEGILERNRREGIDSNTGRKKGIDVGRPGTRPPLPATGAARPAKTRAASLAYVPTAALKAQTVQGYVSRLQPSSPTAAQAVATNFGPGKSDYGQVYRNLTKPSGLAENDAAGVLAALLMMGYIVANDVSSGSAATPAMAQGLRAQVAPVLARNAKLAAPGAAAQAGEDMKLQCVLIHGGWQAATRSGTLPTYRRSIAGLFQKQYGMDLTQLTLTNQGFVKK